MPEWNEECDDVKREGEGRKDSQAKNSTDTIKSDTVKQRQNVD